MQTKLIAPSWKFLLIGGWLAALASPAAADLIAVFYSGGAGYLGPYSGAGTVYNATTGEGISTCSLAARRLLTAISFTPSITFNTTPH